MKQFIATLIFLLAITALQAQDEHIDLPGFGEIPVKKTGNKFSVSIADYGTFDFTGSIDPLELKSDVIPLEELKDFPGYNIYKHIALQEIVFYLSPDGLNMQAKASTKDKLAMLTNALGIDEPFILFNSTIAKGGFALEGSLSFEDDPIVTEVSSDLGTKYSFEALRIHTAMGMDVPGSKKSSKPVLGIKTQMRLKPSKWDPNLKLVTQFTYNLISQELTAAGSMVDTWKNPFGMDNLFKSDDVVSLTNTAVSIGWVPGSPTPTSFGFNVEKAQFFHIKFGTAMSVAPLKGSIALKAKAEKIGLNDLTKIMRDGFGLNVPDIFPDGINIQEPEILFSPLGGKVGEFTIEEGFAVKGQANILEAATAQVEFFANMDEGFYMDYRIDANLKEALMKEIRKVKPLEPVMDQVLSTFELRRVHTRLEAGKDMTMSGSTGITFKVVGQSHSFDMEATLDPKAIIDKIVNKVKEQGAVIKVANKVADVASDAGNAAKDIVEGASDFAKEYSDDVKHLPHSMDRCRNECIPALADRLADPVWDASDQAIWEFYNEVYPELTKVKASKAAIKAWKERKKLIEEKVKEVKKETEHANRLVSSVIEKKIKQLKSQIPKNPTIKKREALIGDQWTELIAQIDEEWENVKNDGTCKGYKCKCDKYKSLVSSKHRKHKRNRENLYQNLITDEPATFDDVYFVKNLGSGMYIDIPGYHFDARIQTPVNVYPKDNVHEGKQGIDRFIKVIPHPTEEDYVYLQPQHSDRVFDILFGSKKPGVGLNLAFKRNKPQKLFKLIEVDGKDNTYYIENKRSGLVLTSNGQSKQITQEKNTKAANQQWRFEPARDVDMAPVKVNTTFALRNVKANSYVDVGGAGVNAGTKNERLQLWDKGYNPDRYITIKNSNTKGWYNIHHNHSRHHYWDIESGRNKNGAKLQLWTKNNKPQQDFRFIYAGSAMTFYIHSMVGSNKYIDASNSRIRENGCPIQIWDKSGQDQQKWKLERVGPKYFVPEKPLRVKVKSAYSSLTWNLKHGGAEKAREKGSKLDIAKDSKSGDRYFTIVPSGDGTWVWFETDGGMRLDIIGHKPKKDAKLQTYSPTTGVDQKFNIRPTSNNTCVIYTKGWKMLDMEGYKHDEPGTDIQVWSQHFKPNQQFQLLDAQTNRPIDFTNLSRYQRNLLFYQNDPSYTKFHKINANSGGLGRRTAKTKNWKDSWSDIEYYQANGQDMMLFYQQSGSGEAEMYKANADGGLAGKVASTKNWSSNWTDIEYYRVNGQDFMLFYQKKSGKGVIYKINSSGTLGGKVTTHAGLRNTWSDIEHYQANGQDMLLFYDNTNGGEAEMYKITANGTIGGMVTKTDNWSDHWADIEYYSAGGKDLMLFYKKSSGTAVLYEIAASGGLARQVKQIKGWRKSWVDIEAK